MFDAVSFTVVMLLTHLSVVGILSRVALASAIHFMLRFQCGLLRNVAAQLITQFTRVIRVNPRIVPPA